MYANCFAACILLGNVYHVLFTFSGMATSYCKVAILAYFVKCLFLLKYTFFCTDVHRPKRKKMLSILT